MRMVRLLAIASALTLGTSVLADAQDHGKAGITIGYPGDIGILWHVSNSIGIRPVFSFTHTTGESATGGTTTGWGTGFGVSALFYLKKFDNVRTYLSPQFTYLHSSTATTPVSHPQVSLPSVDSHGTGTGGNGAFGAQYTPSPHFAVYGELGVGFAHQKTSFSAGGTATSNTGTAWGSFAGVGIVFCP